MDELSIGAVVAAAFALACGYLARRKGRSVAGWAILGFLFPLIALVIILLLPESKPEQAPAPAVPQYPAPPAPVSSQDHPPAVAAESAPPPPDMPRTAGAPPAESQPAASPGVDEGETGTS